MSTVTTYSLSDMLHSTVPRLNAKGQNWGIFYICFMDTIKAKEFWGHFDGTLPALVLSTAATAADIAVKTQWDKDKWLAKTLLTQQLPNSTVMEIYLKKTVQKTVVVE